MGLISSISWFTYAAILRFGILFTAIVLLPGIPPKTDFEFTSSVVTKPQKLEGPLEKNNLLDGAERLLEGRIYGPECLLSHGNDLFATIHGGEVIKINGNHITHVVKFGQPCEGTYQEKKCGRPLGMAFDQTKENLIVADAYFGIWSVNINDGKKKQLVSMDVPVKGIKPRNPKIPNAVAVSSSGDIFWTDSSSEFTIEEGLFAILASGSGRVNRYSNANKDSTTLIDNLSFANGIVLSPNEDFLVVAETGAARLIKYYLKGPKTGQQEIFVDGLPGLPDNLSSDKDGLWVPLISTADPDHPSLLISMSTLPMLRKFIVRLFSLIKLPFKMINDIAPNRFMESAIHNIGNFEPMIALSPSRATIVRIDWSGAILGSLHGFDKSAGAISHVLAADDYLYLGSPFNRFLGRVKLPKSGPKVRVTGVRYEPAQEEAQKQKPTEAPKPKPTEAPKPKPTEAPKPKPTEAPKPVPTEAPKPKPTEAPKPKPNEAPKPKPTEAPKPKPTEAPKPKPTEAPKPAPTQAPKPKPTEGPKPVPTQAPQTAKASQEKPVETQESTTQKPSQPTKTPAPIHESIPKDTLPPSVPKLKVIKKGGDQGEF